MLREVLPVLLAATHLMVVQAVNAHDANPVVTSPMGEIKGALQTTVLGKTIYSFRGIRYAKAPVDELRFQPPVAVEKWNGTYDATQDGPACPQPRRSPQSEDCLFLNVYTTKLPKGKDTPKRPVIVFFHPGGYYSSTGSSQWLGPDYFLDQSVVLVTLNYRLASLGFMSTGDALAPGNNGLKDQVVALRWVKDNIAAFGGDPDLVTICGYSAGGSSVTLHLVSPMSKGLFHRAIAMSGSIFGNWPVLNHQFDLAQKQARVLGCPHDTSANILNCLKTKSAQELGNSLSEFDEFNYDPILIWLPVIEPDVGQERFLTENAVELVQSGQFMEVPVMTGVTTDEFVGPAIDLLFNETLMKEMDEDFERVAPIAFIYERDTENSKHISRELRKFYLGEGPLSNSSLDGLAKLYADGVIGFGVNRGAKLLAVNSKKPVYYYRFSYQGRYSFNGRPDDTEVPYGVAHHDDLLYLFNMFPEFPKFNESFPEFAMVGKLTTLLANFARTGNPTPVQTPELDNTQWDPFVLGPNQYLEIGDKLVMKQNLYEDRYSQWEKLFPLPKGNK